MRNYALIMRLVLAKATPQSSWTDVVPTHKLIYDASCGVMGPVAYDQRAPSLSELAANLTTYTGICSFATSSGLILAE